MDKVNGTWSYNDIHIQTSYVRGKYCWGSLKKIKIVHVKAIVTIQLFMVTKIDEVRRDKINGHTLSLTVLFGEERAL